MQLAASQAAQFQPTLPARGATRLIVSSRLARRISTHAPRTGSDEGCSSSAGTSRHFNPRSPHGERRHAARLYDGAVRFQPTLPARGATRLIVSSRLARRISTHAPRTGSDEGCSSSAGTSRHFNPRSPHGERRHAARLYDGAVRFQPTLPARGATIYLQRRSNRLRYFNPRSPHGERRAASV